eukprot:6171883-Amphidinium_carterae.1
MSSSTVSTHKIRHTHITQVDLRALASHTVHYVNFTYSATLANEERSIGSALVVLSPGLVSRDTPP